MINRTTKLRWRRRYRHGVGRVEDIGTQAENRLEKHFIKRLGRLFDARRFVITWVLLLVLVGGLVVIQARNLGKYYLDNRPAPGGIYTEGMVGSFSNANPLFATGLADSTVSKLVFSGLLTYDNNNHLVGALAQNWTISPDEKTYTVTLKPNLKWQDGSPLTSADVVFTFQTAQNPDAKSPLLHSWQGITIKAVNDRTVTFTLPSALTPFIYSLTTGLIPKHLLGSTEATQLRSANFNTSHPIGAGPFSWQTVEVLGTKTQDFEQHIGLVANDKYYDGRPKLDQFIVKVYGDQDRLISKFKQQEVTAMVGVDSLPESLAQAKNVHIYDKPLNAITFAFFKTDSPMLNSAQVRQALIMATNVSAVVNKLGLPVMVDNEPFLKDQFVYNRTLPQVATNVAEANKLLDAAGWARPAPNQTRQKGKDKLIIKLYGPNSEDFSLLATALQKAWQEVGVGSEATLQNGNDLQTSISNRLYDALLSTVTIGPDPDVFAYWHSSQADPRSASRLNFSDYSSKTADSALEAGRSRQDPALRAAKYVPFLQAWRSDAPAMALYQPNFLYLTNENLYNFDNKSLNDSSDRFNNVANWMIRQGHSLKP